MRELPHLGVGLGFREPLKAGIFLGQSSIDFLEITADHYFNASDRKLRELDTLRQHYTLVPHSLDLSIGSAEGIDEAYLEKLAELIDRVRPPWFSDHIAFTRSGGVAIGHLAPVPFTTEACKTILRNITRVRSQIATPMILENITYNVRFPSHEMSEGEFIRRVLEESDCGLLLDVTNLYINAINLGFDWRTFLDEIPTERVVQLHFVGSRKHGRELIDAHADPTDDAIWNVFREVCRRCDIKGAILERDENFPDFDELVSELENARSIMSPALAKMRTSALS